MRLLLLILLLLSLTLTSKAIITEEELQEVSQRIQVPIKIIQSKEVNAYATKNKGIFVYTGLMEIASANKETMTVVLLHEQGHILKEHIYKLISADSDRQVEYYLCGDKESNKTTLCIKAAYHRYTAKIRKIEHEADDYAFQKAKELGISNKGCEFFKEFSKHEVGAVEEENDHPLSIKRYAKCISILS